MKPAKKTTLSPRLAAIVAALPELKRAALQSISQALVKDGRLFIDGGNPLQEISLDAH